MPVYSTDVLDVPESCESGLPRVDASVHFVAFDTVTANVVEVPCAIEASPESCAAGAAVERTT
ncbi:MAG TPA: hypothetical protein VFN10_18650 [Thermoanaerobaculia bacterium]|nr:hypothetical protein [Thermoanaerobaculia bacterium]